MTSAVPKEIPDPLAFAADALAAQGALVERAGAECVAVLPGTLAAALGVSDTCTLVDGLATGRGDRLACGIGSPLLERLAHWAGARGAAAALRFDGDPPRPSQARALAERFALRNAVYEVEATSVAETTYVVAWLAWRAESDDRYDGRVALAMHAGDGAEPDPSMIALADPTWHGAAFGHAPRSAASTAPLALLCQRAATAVRAAIVPACAAVARRHERDHRRVTEYFTALARDARSPKRHVDPAAIHQKVDHMMRERDAKLRDLAQRYAMRVSLEPLAVVTFVVPAVTVRLRVRRRKREGEMALRLPAGASCLDRVTCAGCGTPTGRPALCDDRLHALCEACVPQIQGRPECAAC